MNQGTKNKMSKKLLIKKTIITRKSEQSQINRQSGKMHKANLNRRRNPLTNSEYNTQVTGRRTATSAERRNEKFLMHGNKNKKYIDEINHERCWLVK